MLFMLYSLNCGSESDSRWPFHGRLCSFGFRQLYPENVKALVLLNSTARADSAERKLNRASSKSSKTKLYWFRKFGYKLI
jgi:hypothetical protein